MCVWIPIKKNSFFIINYRVKTASRANHAKSIWPNQLQVKAQGSQKFRFFFPSPLWWLIRSWHLGNSPVIAFTVSTMCLETFPRSVWRVCVCVCTHTHMYACNCECKGWPRRRKWFQNDQINITYWGIKQGYWHLSLVFFTRLANLQDSRWKSNFKNK